MSFSREIKDFVSAFQAGAKLWNDGEYRKARGELYRAQANKLANPDPLDQKLKELRLQEAEARINLTKARASNVGRSRGRGGSGGGALPDFNPEAYRVGNASSGGQQYASLDAGYDDEDEDEDYGELDNDAITGAIPTSLAASGGMIEGPTNPDDEGNNTYWMRERARAEIQGEPPPASLGDAIGSGLKYLQRSFGLEGENAALPGTDTRRQQGAQALVSGAGAPTDEEMRAVRKTIDPKSEVGDALANSTAVQRVYDFHKARGNEEGAAKAAGQFLQYYRNQSAKLGALAQVALQNNDIDGAVNAVIGGFNQIPDGNVAKRMGDKVMIANAKTGEPVEEIPITPQVISQASRSLSDGASFYTYMAQKAAENGAPGAAPAATPAATPAAEPPAASPASALPAQEPPPGEDGDAPAPGANDAQLQERGIPRPKLYDTARMRKDLLEKGVRPNVVSSMLRGYEDHNRRETADYNAEVRRLDSARRDDTRANRAIEAEDRRASRSEQMRAQNEARLQDRKFLYEELAAQRPQRFSRDEIKELSTEVTTAAQQAYLNTSRDRTTGAITKTAEDFTKYYGIEGVETLRNAAIEVAAYNSRVPADTAARAVGIMSMPYKPEIDETRDARPFMINELRAPKGVTGEQRVVVEFKDRNLPPLVMPKSAIQQIDILRGRLARRDDERTTAESVEAIKRDTDANRAIDIRRAIGTRNAELPTAAARRRRSLDAALPIGGN